MAQEQESRPSSATGAARTPDLGIEFTSESGPLAITEKKLPIALLFGTHVRAATFLAFSHEAFGGRYAYVTGGSWFRYTGRVWVPFPAAMRQLVRLTLASLHDQIEDDRRLPGYPLDVLLSVQRSLALTDAMARVACVPAERVGVLR